jgi:hypothetical protein
VRGAVGGTPTTPPHWLTHRCRLEEPFAAAVLLDVHPPPEAHKQTAGYVLREEVRERGDGPADDAGGNGNRLGELPARSNRAWPTLTVQKSNARSKITSTNAVTKSSPNLQRMGLTVRADEEMGWHTCRESWH